MHSTLAARTSVCIIFNSSQNDFSNMEREYKKFIHWTIALLPSTAQIYFNEPKRVECFLEESSKRKEMERNKWISFVFILCSKGFVSFQGSCKQIIISNFPILQHETNNLMYWSYTENCCVLRFNLHQPCTQYTNLSLCSCQTIKMKKRIF